MKTFYNETRRNRVTVVSRRHYLFLEGKTTTEWFTHSRFVATICQEDFVRSSSADIVEMTDISKSTVHKILTKDLRTFRVHARWVTRMLTKEGL